MISDKGKIICLICCIYFFFIIEQVASSIYDGSFKKLLFIIYPGVAFWVSILAGLWGKKKFNLDSYLLIKFISFAVIISWIIAFALLPIYLPVTSFRIEINVIDIYDISLFRGGWTLIVLSIIWRNVIREVHFR